MHNVRIDYSLTETFVTEEELESMRVRVEKAKSDLLSGNCKGSEYTGWIDLPLNYDKEEFERIKVASERIRGMCNAFVLVGIGGSYLGARSAIEFMKHSFFKNLTDEEREHPQVYFAGQNISATYMNHLMEVLDERDVCINVVSKSGTTLESAIAFRILKKYMEDRYGKEEAAKRIVATTDKEKGALKELADREGYETFVVPDNVGGRFSIFSAVGLFPLAVAGLNIDEFMAGAAFMREYCINNDFMNNDVLMYAGLRNILDEKGKAMEIFAGFEPTLHFVGEWWKQLFAESEGKDGKGLFTAMLDLTTDLHSQGQYVQQGQRTMFETFVFMDEPVEDIAMWAEEDDIEGLNYLEGKTLGFVNTMAMVGTQKAHVDAGVPVIAIRLTDKTEKTMGQFYYFMMFACGVSGLVLGVNPFDQPGVEFYKKNLFKLIGRPGY